jgi:hypothetical protein
MSGRERPALPGSARPPWNEVESLLRLLRGQDDSSWVLRALVRRILEIQDRVSEAELLALVDEVAAIMGVAPVRH